MPVRWNRSSIKAVLILLLSVVGFAHIEANADQETTRNSSDVKILKFPYPYSAAVTIASDTHGTPVETFEAVHTLINTDSRITRNSELWAILFDDPEIDVREEWQYGISGFGLPIADTFFLFNGQIGAFATFDYNTNTPVPHFNHGEDFREIVDEWIRQGWVDTLHTPGGGNVKRTAVEQGLAWLAEKPHRRTTVWINHSLTETPASIEPDVRRALSVVSKNIVKMGTALLVYVGAEPLARKIASNPFPSPFPTGQKVVCWVLGMSFILSLLWASGSLLRGRRRSALIGALSFLVTVTILYKLPLKYAQGDNPESPFYSLDLVRDAGFKYFWFVDSTAGYQSHVANRLGLPELASAQNRRTFLRMVTVDDGTQVITFPRNHKGTGGSHSLELLTEAALEELCREEGTAILYTHWSIDPKASFTARGLDGLQNLRRFYNEKRVWVAPTSDLLHFHFVRTFLEHDVYSRDGKRIINVKSIQHPIGDPVIPTLEDLRGITFETKSTGPIEMQLAGSPIDSEYLQVLHLDDRMIIYIRGFSNTI